MSSETLTPCYLHFCPFGATCRVNLTSNQPVCVCEQRCSDLLSPVCGSDKATYINHCLMDRASCLRGKKIKLVSSGQCGDFFAEHRIRGAFFAIRGEFFAIRGEFFAIRGDFFAMRCDFFAIRGDFFAIRGDFFAIRGDFLAIFKATV
ncbi:Follistatin- protein 4 [Bulinus truncatus]|nr:Follistatin- protein 4 [Bulinus truncatus]